MIKGEVSFSLQILSFFYFLILKVEAIEVYKKSFQIPEFVYKKKIKNFFEKASKDLLSKYQTFFYYTPQRKTSPKEALECFSGEKSCSKYFLSFTAVFCLGGCLVLIMGLWIFYLVKTWKKKKNVTKAEKKNFCSFSFFVGSIGLLIIGISIQFISFSFAT